MIHHGAVRRGCSNQEIYPRVFSICQFLQSQREEQKPAKSFQTFLKYFRNQRLSISNLRSPRGLHHRTAEPIEDMAQCLSIGSYLKTNLWWRMKIEWRPLQMLGTLVRKQALLPYLSSPVIFVNWGIWIFWIVNPPASAPPWKVYHHRPWPAKWIKIVLLNFSIMIMKENNFWMESPSEARRMSKWKQATTFFYTKGRYRQL